MSSSRQRTALLAFGMVFAVLLVNALISYLNIRRLRETDAAVRHTYDVITALDDILSTVLDAETGQHGFLLTDDVRFLIPHQNAIARLDERLEALESLVSDNDEQTAHVAELRNLVQKRLDILGEVLDIQKTKGAAAARSVLMSGSGRVAMERVRVKLEEMEGTERRLLNLRNVESETAYWTAVVAGTIASLLGLLLAIAGYILVLLDIQQRNLAAADLQAANERLEERVRERERVEGKLREADRRKDQFLATLAHELRNPLSPLSSAAQLIGMEPEKTEQVRDLTVVMTRQLGQLVRLIDDLLDVSRISGGKLQLRKTQIPLRDPIAAALDVSRPLIHEAGHQLQVSQPPEAIIVEGDPVRLTQIIGNLLINAAKYTPPHGTIELSVRTEGERVAIRVRDSGVGIPAEMQSEIFEMFTQVDSSHTRQQGGLGIGLTLVRTLVEMHGGTIHVFSGGPGTGSEFTVYLPLVATGESAGAETNPSVAATASEKLPLFRVLIVDDSESAAHLLARLLDKLGQTVEVAYSAETALELVRRFEPQLVISDVGMPDVSGLKLAERIRSLTNLKQPQLVALTGYGQESDHRDIMAAGFDKHFTKPISLSVLEQLISSIGT